MQLNLSSLPSDHSRFSIQSPSVAIDFAGFSDHPVTGDQVGHRVLSHGTTCGLEAPWIMDMLRYCLVGDQLAKGDAQQGFPDF